MDSKMVYVAETTTGGKKTLDKITFSKLPNGNVRQLAKAQLIMTRFGQKILV